MIIEIISSTLHAPLFNVVDYHTISYITSIVDIFNMSYSSEVVQPTNILPWNKRKNLTLEEYIKNLCKLKND